METGNDAKTTRLTWHNILHIPQKYPKDLEPNQSYGRKPWNWAIIGIMKCTAGRKLIAEDDD